MNHTGSRTQEALEAISSSLIMDVGQVVGYLREYTPPSLRGALLKPFFRRPLDLPPVPTSSENACP